LKIFPIRLGEIVPEGRRYGGRVIGKSGVQPVWRGDAEECGRHQPVIFGELQGGGGQAHVVAGADRFDLAGAVQFILVGRTLLEFRTRDSSSGEDACVEHPGLDERDAFPTAMLQQAVFGLPVDKRVAPGE